jgi:murein DD-endopeptidase MepM/ murein hydrolase activator NlpD
MANRRNSGTPLPVYIALACSVLLNAGLLLTRGGGSAETAAVETEDLAGSGEVEGDSPLAVATAEARAPEAAPQAVVAPAGEWAVLHADVKQSLARTFQLEAGDDGDALSSVYTRLFVWDVDMRRDLKAGDSLGVVWRKAKDGLPEIAAAEYSSTYLGKTLAAYRWQAPGDSYASYWRLDGTEAPLRLKGGPLEQYEQITSLLKDRPTHKGMDFKTPIGTEVHSPKAGTVTRVNWNWGANGNCVEVRYGDGVLAKFLHLSENRVKEGDRVAEGQVIALTGNTGHSTAPHLHYQLDQGTKVLDPLDYHGTVRRSLTADQVASLKRDVAGYEQMLQTKGGSPQ